jgi:hypothetical protein
VLKEHLEKWHPGVNPDAELEEVKRSGRSATAITRYPPQISPSTPELEQLGLAESQLNLLTLPPPVEPTNMKNKRQNARQFVALNSSYARTPFPLIEEHSRVAQDLGVYARAHIRFAHALSIQY